MNDDDDDVYVCLSVLLSQQNLVSTTALQSVATGVIPSQMASCFYNCFKKYEPTLASCSLILII